MSFLLYVAAISWHLRIPIDWLTTEKTLTTECSKEVSESTGLCINQDILSVRQGFLKVLDCFNA